MAVVNTTVVINTPRYNSNNVVSLDLGWITRNASNYGQASLYFRVCDYGNDGIFAFPASSATTSCTVSGNGLTSTIYPRFTGYFSGLTDNIPEWGSFSNPLLYRVRVNDDNSCTILLDNIYSYNTDVSTLTASNPVCLNNSYGAAINAEYTVSTSIPDVSVSSDYSPIIKSVLMIPAAMLILGFFFIIYRIFINKDTRG